MLIHSIVAITAAVAANPSDVAVETTAVDWVLLVDQQKWADSWKSAGATFRSQLTSEQWASAVAPVRVPLGAVHSRKLENITSTKSLPGAPNGDYRVVTFRTTFEKKADAVETLIVANSASGWSVNGYFIR
jgi:hypothetical protein